MPNQKTDQNQSVIVLAIFLVVVGVGWSAYQLIPRLKIARDDLTQKTAIGEGLDKEEATLKQTSKQLKDEKARLTSRGVNFSMIRSVYPLTEDRPGLFLLMEDLIKDRKEISQLDYTIGEPVMNDTSTGVVIPVTMNATGEYKPLLKYITEVQQALRPVTVTKVELTQAGAPPTTGGAGADNAPAANVSATAYKMTLTGYVRAEGLSAAYAPSATPTP